MEKFNLQRKKRKNPPSPIPELRPGKCPRLSNEEVEVHPLEDEDSSSLLIHWGNVSYDPLYRMSLSNDFDEIFAKACVLGRLTDTHLKSINDVGHRTKLEGLRDQLALVFHHLLSQSNDDVLTVLPLSDSRLNDSAGVYGLSWSLDGHEIKVGMSENCFPRATRQKPKFAFKFADRKRLFELIPRSLIDPIVNLSLPGIQFHKDHEQRWLDLIVMQLFEAFLAAAIRGVVCVTKTVLERLVQSPPPLHHLSSKCKQKAMNFLRDVPKRKVHAFFTWPTMKSIVHDMITMKKELRQYLNTRIDPLPEGDFCKKYWIEMLFEKESLHSWEDLMISPRKKMLDEFLAKVDSLLEEEDPSRSEENNSDSILIKAAYSLISGENKTSYLRPSAQEMGEQFIKSFSDRNETLAPDMVFYVERSVLDAARQINRQWVDNLIGNDVIHVGPTEWELSLVTTTTKRSLIVTSSFFLPFSPEVQKHTTRVAIVKNLITFLELMGKDSARSAVVSYLMAMTFYDDDETSSSSSFQRDAARSALPQGYLKTPPPKCKTVSTNMGLEMFDHFYVMFRLGDEKFGRLLRHLGHFCPPENQQRIFWPSHPDFSCPGCPGTRKFQPVPCCSPQNQNVCMVGKEKEKGKRKGFWGLWLCVACWKKIEPRELDFLKNLEVRSEEEEHRLSNFQTAAVKYRNKQMKIEGKEAFAAKERKRSRKAKPRGDRTVYHKNYYVNNKDRFIKGEERAIRTKRRFVPYPTKLMDKLKLGCLWFFRMHPKPSNPISWSNFMKVMLAILEAEWDNFEIKDSRTKIQKLVMYRKPSFEAALHQHAVRATKKNHWTIKPASRDLVFQEYQPSSNPLKQIVQDITKKLCLKKKKIIPANNNNN